MNFLICLILASCLVYFGRDFIKNHSNICYALTTILGIGLVIGSYTNFIWSLPHWMTVSIIPILIKSTFATALFVIVMYTGAFKKGGKLIKFLMPIRAQLSIMACILTLAHNISFGRYYFIALFTAPETLALNSKIAACISLVLIAIMIPLFITSFPSVRKSMKPKSWKKLQRLAYLFYGLVYAHVMVLMVPIAINGVKIYIINVLAYSVVFITYAVMRIRKAVLKKSSKSTRDVSKAV